MKNKKRIIYAFIDSQNLNLGTSKNIYERRKLIYKGWRLDFARFRVYLKDKYQVEKAFLFIGYLSKNKTLYHRLKRAGYTLVFKPILRGRKGIIKGNVDAELVLHTMIEYPNYDSAVIISGDGDFHCLIEYLEKESKLLRVIIPNRKKYSQLFSEFNPYLAFMNNLQGKLKEQKRGASPRHKSLRLSPHRDK